MSAVRRIVLPVAPADVEPVLDRLMPLLPDGVHVRRDGRSAEIVALEGPAGLVPAAVLEAAAADLLLARAREDTVPSLEAELDRLRPRWLVGDELVVRHPDGEPLPGRTEVLIERAQGFGSGAHPTTRMCLALLLRTAQGGSFVDLGCGAGVLVIAAAKLGWSPVAGIDMTAGAIDEARANATLNGVDAAFTVADLRTAELPAARVAGANVSSPPVHARLAEHGLPGTETLLFSGLGGEEADTALAAYAEAGFAETTRLAEASWVAARLDRAA